MRIPGAERAVVDPFKVRNYLLSTEHKVGRHKAAFFAKLGYHRRNWLELAHELHRHVRRDDAGELAPTAFGTKYMIAAHTTGPTGFSAIIVSVWIIRTDEDFPRLVTAYRGRIR